MAELTSQDLNDIGFMCACYLDDLEKQIKKKERQDSRSYPEARENHANKTRLVYTKVIPNSLKGHLKLLDGTTLTEQF